MDLNDNELINKYLAGEDEAFEHVLKKYLKPIYNFLYRLTHDKTTAEDLAQVTFFKAWKSLRRFDQSKNFKVWLFTIAKNTAYDSFRKKKALPFSHYTDENGNNKLENIIDGGSSPNDLLEKKDLAHQLFHLLEKIPLHYRAILLLRYKQGFSLKETAAILKKPYNTVKSRHQRALKYINNNFPLDRMRLF